MTPIAINMMIIAMLTVWGGLALSMWNLARHLEDHAIWKTKMSFPAPRKCRTNSSLNHGSTTTDGALGEF